MFKPSISFLYRTKNVWVYHNIDLAGTLVDEFTEVEIMLLDVSPQLYSFSVICQAVQSLHSLKPH